MKLIAHYSNWLRSSSSLKANCRLLPTASGNGLHNSQKTTALLLTHKNYHHHKRHSSTTSSSDLTLLQLEKETQFTKRYIDNLVLHHGSKSSNDDENSYSYDTIQTEIQEASAQIGKSIPESGPTGQYHYFFHDDLALGKRTYYRKPSTIITDTPSSTSTTTEVKHHKNQKIFDINLHNEYLGPMSLSIDEKYVVRLAHSIGKTSKAGTIITDIIVTDIKTGLSYAMDRNTNTIASNLSNIEFGPKFQKHSQDYHTIFITRCNEFGRPSAIHACTFNGQKFGSVELILEDTNEAHLVDVQRTKGCEYVAINSTSKTSNEVHILGGTFNKKKKCKRDEGRIEIPWDPILVKPRERKIQYYVECSNKGEVILLAHKFPEQKVNYKSNPITIKPREEQRNEGQDECYQQVTIGDEISIFETSIEDLPLTSTDFGKPIHMHNAKSTFFVEDIDLFQDNLVLYERSSTSSDQRIRVIDRTTSKTNIRDDDLNYEHIIPINEVIPEGGIHHYIISMCGNMQFDAKTLKFNVESPLTPPMSFEYDFYTRSFITNHDDDTKMYANSTTTQRLSNEKQYNSRRVQILSHDGNPVPLSFYFDKTVRTRGVLLIGYGCYGQNQNLGFDPALIPLVKRGFVVAYCHGRGGGDLGKKHYEGGRLYNKNNAIEDYICCAKAISNDVIKLLNQGNDVHDEGNIFLASKSFSAGGVIIGAAVNRLPKLFDAVSLINPYLDVMGSILNSSDYLIEHEWDEFGNVNNDNAARRLVTTYCPLLNVRTTERYEKSDELHYPPMFIVSTIDDENVPFYHGVNFGMKVREAMQPYYVENEGLKNQILLHIENEGGHHLHGRRLDVSTLEICFLLGQLNASSKV